MKTTTFVLILIAINFNSNFKNFVSAQARRNNVTNEDIQNTLLSLVHSYTLLDNKLERHEQRERSLGEIIKKSFQTLQKGQRVFEPIKGTFSRLEERIGQIETLLIAQEERISEQQIKLAEALESVFKWMTHNTATTTTNKKIESRFDSDESKLEKRIDELQNHIITISKEIQELKNIKIVDKETTNKLISQNEKLIIETQHNNPDLYFSNLKDELKHFYVTNPPEPKENDFEKQLINELAEIKIGLQSIKSRPPPKIDFDKSFIEGMTNQTIDMISKIKYDLLSSSDKNLNKIITQIKENDKNKEKTLNSINEQIKTSKKLAEEFYDQFNGSDSGNTIETMKKLEETMTKTANDVLDTKKHIEFGILQIIVEVEDRIKKIIEDMDKGMNKRLDVFTQTSIENHQEMLTNVSSKVEGEMGKVWRQIGIMFNELSTHKSILEKLQQYTETYVNTTTKSIEDGGEKIAAITVRVEEMYSNLNYLLGRLSLVNQEFNNIKTGLGAAIENLKSTFSVVKKNIADIGPGPHNIDESEVHDDSNLVKRYAYYTPKRN